MISRSRIFAWTTRMALSVVILSLFAAEGRTENCDCTPASAALWAAAGVPVANLTTSTASLSGMSEVPSGGAVVTWLDNRVPSTQATFVQRLDALGRAIWPANGIRVGSLSGAPSGLELPSAVLGTLDDGALVAWVSQYSQGGTMSGDLRIQKVTATGTLANGPDGLPITTFGPVNSNSVDMKAIAGGDGLLAFAGLADQFVYVRRIGANGTPVWQANQRTTTSTRPQYEPSVSTLPDGSSIVVWRQTSVSGDYEIRAQKLDASGVALWGLSGILVCGAPGLRFGPKVVAFPASREAIVAWIDERSSPSAVFAQRLDQNGVPRWTPNGEVVAPSIAVQYGFIGLQPCGLDALAEGACAVWRTLVPVQNDPNDVVARRIRNGATFSLDWAAPVTIVSQLNFNNPVVAHPGEAGSTVLVGWTRASTAFAQRIGVDGTTSWPFGGVALNTGGYIADGVQVVPDGLNGVLAGRTNRTSVSPPADFDVYAARAQNPFISPTLSWNAPSTGFVLTCPQGDASSLDISVAFPFGFVRTVKAEELEYRLPDAPNVMLYNNCFFPHASGNASAPGWSATISQSKIGGCVSGNAHVLLDGTEIGQIAIATRSPDFQPASPGFVDAADVAALSNHMGCSPPNCAPCFDLTGDGFVDASDLNGPFARHYRHACAGGGNLQSGDQPVTTELTATVLRCLPNPARRGQTVTFELRLQAENHVGLTLVDASGRNVRELYSGRLSPGPHMLTWDGLDRAGNRARAGLYFVRWEVGGRRTTSGLMVLL